MELILTSIIAFVTTNIDDIFVLALLFGNKKFKESEIIFGQFLGIAALIIISLVGSFIGLVVDAQYIGLLGFAPIYFGIKAIFNLSKSEANEENIPVISTDSKSRSQNVFSVASVTIANGGDNISIYVPLFATLAFSGKATMILIFLAITLIWCFTAKYLVSHPWLEKRLEKYSHLVTPFVFVFLGIYILYESGTFKLLSFHY